VNQAFGNRPLRHFYIAAIIKEQFYLVRALAVVNKLVKFTLDKDKSLVAEGGKIGFTFSVNGDLPPSQYRSYYFLINGFAETDIDAIVFPKAPNGIYLDGGYWNPNGKIFSLNLFSGESAKSFDIVFKKDAIAEIVEGGYISMAVESRGGYTFEYKYSENGASVGLNPKGISVLDSFDTKALIELSSASASEGEGIGSTLIYSGIGSKVYWRVLGVDASDLWTHPESTMSGISGETIVNYEGRVRLGHFIINDSKTEGEELFKIQYSLTDSFATILAESVAIPIGDTSTDPEVTLDIVADPVVEDGVTNLVYIFARTGSTSSELSVNYTVGGTARMVSSGTDASDYSFVGSSSTATSRIVTFAVGSATATVNVDPTADSAVEENETVALTLAVGSGYTIGTKEAVIGTISNDDITPAIPSITSVGGSDSVVSSQANDSSVVGTAVAGVTVTIKSGTSTLGTTTANGSGAFSYGLTPANLTTLGQGTGKSISATASDSAGNSSAASTAFGFAVRTVAPEIPSITSVGGSDSVVSSQANDSSVVGTAVAGVTVTIKSGTSTLGTTTANGSGAFSYGLTPANLTTLGQGTGKSISATASDSAGNSSAASTAFGFAVFNAANAVVSSTSIALSGSQSSLLLTGSKRINGTGNSLNNTLVGNANNNRLFGGIGKDVLIGGGISDSDIFAYNSLTESLLGGFDIITDYNNRDRIQAPTAVSEEAVILTSSRGITSDLTSAAIASVLTESNFVANNVAAFTVTGWQGTFIAMNDGRAGFQADSDAISHLQNYAISTQNFVDFL